MEWAPYAVAAAGAILARKPLWERVLWPWVFRPILTNAGEHLGHVIAGLVRDDIADDVDAKLAPVIAEVRPNGGLSLKDQVSRLEQSADRLEEHLETGRVERAAIARAVDDLTERHARLEERTREDSEHQRGRIHDVLNQLAVLRGLHEPDIQALIRAQEDD